MDIDKKKLKMLHSIEKELMHSLLYYNKNLIDTAERFKRHDVNEEFQQLIFDSMATRYRIAKDLKKDLESFLNEFSE